MHDCDSVVMHALHTFRKMVTICCCCCFWSFAVDSLTYNKIFYFVAFSTWCLLHTVHIIGNSECKAILTVNIIALLVTFVTMCAKWIQLKYTRKKSNCVVLVIVKTKDYKSYIHSSSQYWLHIAYTDVNIHILYMYLKY